MNNINKTRKIKTAKSGSVILLAIAIPFVSLADGWGNNTQATNRDSIVNTRHNLTQSFSTLGNWMDTARNNYGEVCVYCHTPHGANTTIAAPLWNRTNKANTYTLYNIPLTSGQTPTNPGVNSLACISCHDGVTAIDSVINIPGSGRYNQAQETTVSQAFLSNWKLEGNPGPLSPGHADLQTCADRCHNSSIFTTKSDLQFNVFVIGTDLTNDHPIGVQLPDTNVYDFKAPTGTSGALKFFDTNSNGKPDKSEVRFYNTGGGFEVECASCHDPHGVPSAGPGSVFIPSFLRVSNTGSVLCMTCHDK